MIEIPPDLRSRFPKVLLLLDFDFRTVLIGLLIPQPLEKTPDRLEVIL